METKENANTLLASTAYWTASVRAMESQRSDSLFKDPLAGALAGQVGAGWIAQRTPEKVLPIVLRTRYFDDFLERIHHEQGIRHVVLMAAGLDTRAFRLQWAQGVQLFEIDQPAVMQYKQQVLSATKARPACTRFVIEQDLTGPWQEALIVAGFLPNTPSLWLLEGFLFYLPCEQVTAILEDVSALASPGSWIGFDIINDDMLTHPITRAWVDMHAAAGAPWIGTLNDPESFLAGLGWKADLTQAGQPDAHYGRWALPVLPTRMPGMPHNWFVTAQKQK
jgi:methyltransferase (TIGR00027 family)